MTAIERIAIIGAGQMGAGIAQAAAEADYKVTLFDAAPAALPKAIETITRNLERQVLKNQMTVAAKDAALAAIQITENMELLASADMVIEAIVENETAKTELYARLKNILKPNAILATTTSSISITRLGAASGRADKFIGMHFMNPVPVMQLVEVIKGIATSAETFAAAMQVVERLGKTAAASEDYPGFIVNRLLIPMINDAVQALQEGVGDAMSIDNAMRLSCNMPMGPLELADFIGLDHCLGIMRLLHSGMGDLRYRPAPLLVKYVDAGWIGKKSGKGFYDYTGAQTVPTRLAA
jgi:3-hydroxybutyryl-CoA dehydrogenase